MLTYTAIGSQESLSMCWLPAADRSQITTSDHTRHHMAHLHTPHSTHLALAFAVSASILFNIVHILLTDSVATV